MHIIHGASRDSRTELTAHLTCRARRVQRGIDAEKDLVYKNVAQRKRVMICRGLGKRISVEEKAQWDPQVLIVFQKKAWADTNFMMTCAYLMVGDPAVDPSKSSIWHMDSPGAHHAPRVTQALKTKCNGKAHYYLAQCSGELQLVDTELGAAVKSNMGRYRDKWLKDYANLKTWASNKPSACDWRVLLTRWLAQAWEEVCKRVDIDVPFHEVGTCLTVGGSMDHMLRIEMRMLTRQRRSGNTLSL